VTFSGSSRRVCSLNRVYGGGGGEMLLFVEDLPPIFGGVDIFEGGMEVVG
jgi:hypothetical protein